MASQKICPVGAVVKSASKKGGQGGAAAVILAGSAAVGNAETVIGTVGDAASKVIDKAKGN